MIWHAAPAIRDHSQSSFKLGATLKQAQKWCETPNINLSRYGVILSLVNLFPPAHISIRLFWNEIQILFHNQWRVFLLCIML